MHGAQLDEKLNEQYPKRQCDIFCSGNGISLEKVTTLAKKYLVSEELSDKLQQTWSWLRDR